MKLVKALNGDWVNVAHASSFNVADFGNRAVVFARIGNVSYELFSAEVVMHGNTKAELKLAEKFLDDLFNKLGEVLSTPANELKSVFLTPGEGIATSQDVKHLGKPAKLPEGAKVEYIAKEDKTVWVNKKAHETIIERAKASEESTPKKRATRKPKTGEEG